MRFGIGVSCSLARRAHPVGKVCAREATRRQRKPRGALPVHARRSRRDDANASRHLQCERAEKELGLVAEAVDADDERKRLAGLGRLSGDDLGVLERHCFTRARAMAGTEQRSSGESDPENE